MNFFVVLTKSYNLSKYSFIAFLLSAIGSTSLILETSNDVIQIRATTLNNNDIKNNSVQDFSAIQPPIKFPKATDIIPKELKIPIYFRNLLPSVILYNNEVSVPDMRDSPSEKQINPI